MAERLICDAMLGHLARWLRAAGHDAAFVPNILEADLVARAIAERRILVTSDQLLMKNRRIQDGTVRAVFVPVGFSHLRQLRHLSGDTIRICRLTTVRG